MDLILSVIYVLTYGSNIPEVHPCAMDISHLSLEQKIEISIGCSRVNGEYVYSRGKLTAIANFSKEKSSD